MVMWHNVLMIRTAATTVTTAKMLNEYLQDWLGTRAESEQEIVDLVEAGLPTKVVNHLMISARAVAQSSVSLPQGHRITLRIADRNQLRGDTGSGSEGKGLQRCGWLANSRGVHFTYFLNTEAKYAGLQNPQRSATSATFRRGSIRVRLASSTRC